MSIERHKPSEIRTDRVELDREKPVLRFDPEFEIHPEAWKIAEDRLVGIYEVGEMGLDDPGRIPSMDEFLGILGVMQTFFPEVAKEYASRPLIPKLISKWFHKFDDMSLGASHVIRCASELKKAGIPVDIILTQKQIEESAMRQELDIVTNAPMHTDLAIIDLLYASRILNLPYWSKVKHSSRVDIVNRFSRLTLHTKWVPETQARLKVALPKAYQDEAKNDEENCLASLRETLASFRRGSETYLKDNIEIHMNLVEAGYILAADDIEVRDGRIIAIHHAPPQKSEPVPISRNF